MNPLAFGVLTATDLAFATLAAVDEHPKPMTNPLIRGNAYAPQWMTGIFQPPETPAGFADRQRQYAKTIVVGAGSSLFNQAILIDGNSDFLAREVAFFPQLPVIGINYGDIQVRFRDGAGNRLSADFLNPQDIQGPIFPELFVPMGTTFLIDIKNTSAGSITFQTVLRGVKRYKSGAIGGAKA